MNINVITLTAALFATGAQADSAANVAAERSITVCTEFSTGVEWATRSRWIASEMFANIGVTVDWRHDFKLCPSDAIRISVGVNTPGTLLPGALADALPYEGTHIRVFYDRIVEKHAKREVPSVMAHVLVHEITHILQAINRHSESGVMKATWGPRDFREMSFKPLGFAPEDIDLIYRGLVYRARAQRTARQALALASTAPASQPGAGAFEPRD
jgi:hypothetical protein